eukprot:g49618.t1
MTTDRELELSKNYRNKVQNDYMQKKYPKGVDSAWIALKDPASGNFYYFNEMSGQCTWDMPEAFLSYK